jgi:NADH-quinone oxidoreductase subunit G
MSQAPSAAPPTPTSLTIDGVEVAVPKGTLIIRAAEQLGILIPRFCDHPLLAPAAACRQCYVSVEGQRKLMTACSTPVAEGMVVKTQYTDPAVKDAQEAVLEFLLINHPLDCPICDRGGECPLQDQALMFGPGESRYREAKRTYRKPIPLSPLVNLDRERCVLCQRCTRFCDEISGDRFIELFDRGAAEQIAIAAGEDFDSPFSGNTIQICPVGALTATTYRFSARPFDMKRGTSVCTLCASGCNLLVQTRRGQVVRQLAWGNPDVNEEWLCDKGRFAFAFQDRPERLATPMLRDRGLEPVSYAEAFAAIGGAMRSGRSAFVVGGRLSDEDAYVLSRFARQVARTNDVDARPLGATLAPVAVEAEGAGGGSVTYADVERARMILVVGLDAESELPILHLRLRKAARRGVRIVVVHSRRTRLDDVAEHVLVRPGDEASLLRSYLDGDDGVGADLRASGGDAVVLAGPRCAETNDTVAAARELASATRARFCLLARRVGDHGALRAGLRPELLPGGRFVNLADDRAGVATVWGAGAVPSEPGRDVGSILRAAADREIDVLFLVGVDLLRDAPDPVLARAALENAPLKVVIDTALHEDVAPYIDVALPACVSIERQGTFSDWEGRPQRFHPVRSAFGMSRPEWQILQALAESMGSDMGFRTIESVRAELDRIAALDASAAAAPAAPAPAASAGSADNESRATTTASGDDGSMLLFSYPLLVDEGRQLDGADLLRAALEREAFLEIHPGDASRLQLEDGGYAQVATATGTARLPVVVTDGVPPGACFVPWNNPGLAANALFAGSRTVAATVTPAEQTVGAAVPLEATA